jgi:hypothetical protein
MLSGRPFSAARFLVAMVLAGGLAACGQGNDGSIKGDKYAAYSETVPDYAILDDEAAMADVQFGDSAPKAVEDLKIRVVSYSTAAEEASKCGIFLAEISEWGAMNCGRD